MEVEQTLNKMSDFLRLSKWRKDKYGKKYTDMDWAETIIEEQQKELSNRYTPTLFN